MSDLDIVKMRGSMAMQYDREAAARAAYEKEQDWLIVYCKVVLPFYAERTEEVRQCYRDMADAVVATLPQHQIVAEEQRDRLVRFSLELIEELWQNEVQIETEWGPYNDDRVNKNKAERLQRIADVTGLSIEWLETKYREITCKEDR